MPKDNLITRFIRQLFARKSDNRTSMDRPAPRRIESLENREMLSVNPGGDIAHLSDEFDNSATQSNWSRINEVEGWNADQLQTYDINQTQAGRMVMAPHSSVWYQDYRGPMAFKEVTGDFVFTSEIHISDLDNLGVPDADDIPNEAQFSLGGLMIRTPRNISDPSVDWSPGSMADDGTNTGENFVFLSLGHGVDGGMSLEVKTTRNSDSQLSLTPIGSNMATIQLAKIGDTILMLYQLPGQEWVIHQRYSRPDMPDTLQVGMVTYSDWEKANDFTPFYQNSNVLTAEGLDPTPGVPFNPDLEAGFEYARYARPDLPSELDGIDLLTEATDEQLLSFLGDHANHTPAPADAPLVSVAGSVNSVLESNATDLFFSITREQQDLQDDLIVNYSLSGTVDGNDLSGDYQAIFAAGESSISVSIPNFVDDLTPEALHSISLQIANSSDYQIAQGSDTIDVIDDDFESIGDLVINGATGIGLFTLPGIHVDGSSIEYSVSVVPGQLFLADYNHGLFTDGDYYTNWGGQNEKWLRGTGSGTANGSESGSDWFYLLQNGSLFLWDGDFASSQLIAQFDPTIYENPEWLHSAELPGQATLDGNELTLVANTDAGFQIEIIKTKGSVTSIELISVSQSNAAPHIDTIPNQLVHPNDLPLLIDILASDSDGDSVQLSVALVESLVYQLDQVYGFQDAQDYYQNWGGQNEKWIKAADESWFFLLEDGGLYRWVENFEGSELIANLGTDIYNDPGQLTEAEAIPVNIQMVGNQIQIESINGFTGEFEVRVIASDGQLSSEQVFSVMVTNEAPVIEPIADQNGLVSDGAFSIQLNANDADGDEIAFAVNVINPLYELDQFHAFQSTEEYYENWLGQNEKWIQDGNNDWFYLLADGGLYRWTGDFVSSEFISQVGVAVYTDPSLLTNAENPEITGQVTLDEFGNYLLELAWDGEALSGFQGELLVRIVLDDGIEETVSEFALTLE